MQFGMVATNRYYGNSRIWATAIKFHRYIIFMSEDIHLDRLGHYGSEQPFDEDKPTGYHDELLKNIKDALVETNGGTADGRRNRFYYIRPALAEAARELGTPETRPLRDKSDEALRYIAPMAMGEQERAELAARKRETSEGKTMKDYMVRITDDVEVQLDCERYLLERGDRIAVVSPRLVNAFKWMLKDAKVKDVYDHDNMLTICDGTDSIDVFIANLGMPVARDTKIILADGNAMLQIGDRILVEATPAVGITGRIPFRSIGQFAKQYAKWSDEQVRQRIDDIKNVTNPRHQRAMLKQWVSEIQKSMGKKPEAEAKPEEPEEVEGELVPGAEAPAAKAEPEDEEVYKVVERYEDLDSPMTNYAKSPFIMRSREAGEKLATVIGRALTANKVKTPEMEVVRTEFGAAEGRHEFKYVIVYRIKPDQVQELMTMGAAAAMVASKGKL